MIQRWSEDDRIVFDSIKFMEDALVFMLKIKLCSQNHIIIDHEIRIPFSSARKSMCGGITANKQPAFDDDLSEYRADDRNKPRKQPRAGCSVDVHSCAKHGDRDAASSDGGSTWSEPVYLPHNGVGWESADVTMAWGKNGTLYLVYVDYIPNTNSDGGDFIVSSTDGGHTWSAPVKAIDASADTDVSLDRPWLVVDTSGTATNGNLYLCTKPAPWNPLPNHSYFTRSTDGGQDWDPERVLDTVTYSAQLIPAPMGSPAVASNGTLYIAYPYLSGLSGGFALAVSHDGGLSFTRSFLLLPYVGAKMNDSVKDAFRLIVNPANPDHLLFAWADQRNGDYDIFASASTNAGASWSAPERVNDDPIGNGVMQDMLWPTFGVNGSLAMIWRDRRNGLPNGYASASDTYVATSSNGGLNWSGNRRLSSATASYDSILFGPGNDFMSAAIANDSLYAVWADTRSDSLRVFFAAISMEGSSGVTSQIVSQRPDLIVIPNPASGTASLSFQLPSSEPCTISIYNEDGIVVRQVLREMLPSGTHLIQCPVSGLPNGSYFIELQTPNGVSRAKLTLK